jgi:hypothetical protein
MMAVTLGRAFRRFQRFFVVVLIDPSTSALFVMADDSILRSSVLKDKKTLVCEWCVE